MTVKAARVKGRKDAMIGASGYCDMPGHLLRRCHQIAVAIFLQECKDLDLTPLQFVVLSALTDHGPLDQTALAGLTALDRTTIGVVVGKLGERGFIVRRRSEADRRANVITCTDAGRALLAKALPAANAAQTRMLAPLKRDERKLFLSFLRRVTDENNLESRAPLKAG